MRSTHPHTFGSNIFTYLHWRYLIANNLHGSDMPMFMPGDVLLDPRTGAYDDRARIYSPYAHTAQIHAEDV